MSKFSDEELKLNDIIVSLAKQHFGTPQGFIDAELICEAADQALVTSCGTAIGTGLTPELSLDGAREITSSMKDIAEDLLRERSELMFLYPMLSDGEYGNYRITAERKEQVSIKLGELTTLQGMLSMKIAKILEESDSDE